MSRDERAALGGESGFAPLQLSERCEDCRDVELSAPTLYDPERPEGRRLGFRRNFRCGTCRGYGFVPARVIDPYFVAKRG